MAAVVGAVVTILHVAYRGELGCYWLGMVDMIAVVYWIAWIFLLGRTVGKEA